MLFWCLEMGRGYAFLSVTFFDTEMFVVYVPMCLCKWLSVLLSCYQWSCITNISCVALTDLSKQKGSSARKLVQNVAFSVYYLHLFVGVPHRILFLHILPEASLDTSIKRQKALWPSGVCAGWLRYLWVREFCSKAIRFVFLSNVAAISACVGFSPGHKKDSASAGIVLSSVAWTFVLAWPHTSRKLSRQM